jgi:hypothetical protein
VQLTQPHQHQLMVRPITGLNAYYDSLPRLIAVVCTSLGLSLRLKSSHEKAIAGLLNA